MAKFADLLFELGTEELPATVVKKFPSLLREALKEALFAQHLAYEEIKTFATPRRIAVYIKGLITQQPDRTIERKGPAVSQAFTADGKLTPAGEGFAKSCHLDLAAMQKLRETCTDRLMCHLTQPGVETSQLLPGMIENSLKKALFGRTMRWGTLDEPFIRPVLWVLFLFGDKKINGQLFGKEFVQHTFGHRFLAPTLIAITKPSDYEKKLSEEGFVIPSFEKRKENILKQTNQLAAEKKIKPLIEESLLDEVTGLVEWPVALLGHFDQAFLSVPQEALITSMKVNQKCFPLVDGHGKLTPYFILISNIESKDKARVIAGNEKVVRARLSDAKFFFEKDKQQSLISRTEDLKKVIFQAELGSLYEKTERVVGLSKSIAYALHIDSALVERAAMLSKTDLTTEMVGEFPELQGIMGKYYAWHDKEPEEVCFAIEEHYLPRFANDKLPETLEGQVVALADRIDTLVGLFAINKQPTGDKDPFALRRAAQGVVRICVEHKLAFDLLAEINKASSLLAEKKLSNKNAAEQVWTFIGERQRVWYADQGIGTDLYNAVAATQCTNLVEFDHRILAVKQFLTLPQAAALAATNKRVANLLQKQDKSFLEIEKINSALLTESSEIKLAEELEKKDKIVTPLYQQGNFAQGLQELATLQKPIDDFFENVMVMVEDKALRDNRLCLLNKARKLFLQVADVSQLNV